ncbi:hypothetical protein [Acetobacterium malicum]|uniref:hypothetical protein n=1 Tax=Acetobacterium malicum TaxID=52692 RepID=UPI00146FC611|nr:hypothetical protein [Acetobacterium dehalogenans]
MSHYKSMIKIAITPCLILGLVIFRDYFIRYQAANLQFDLLWYRVLFDLFLYISTGILLAGLYERFKKIRALRMTKVVLSGNILMLMLFCGVSYFGVLYFASIKEFFVFDFILMGYYAYLLIDSLRKEDLT